jgi:phosphoribosyl 1,2-cyclic phosphodiesterase
VKAIVLGTGSRGNAVVIETSTSRVLIDAGFARRELAGRLRAARIAPESIEGVVLTHEHQDHACGAALAAAKWHWPVYATRGTISMSPELLRVQFRVIDPGQELALGGAMIEIIRIAHDAQEPIGVVATDVETGARLGVIYDLGSTNASLVSRCRDLDAIIIESNHDPRLLARSEYPPIVQRRIASRVGHLSNRAAADFTGRIAHRGLRHVVLAHLSEQCNSPSLAVETMSSALRRTRFRGQVSASLQDVVNETSIVASKPKARAEQLALF